MSRFELKIISTYFPDYETRKNWTYKLRYRKKICHICKKEKDILFRCRYEENFIERSKIYANWVFVCESCLKQIKIKFHDTYQYGGTWKNKKK